MPYRTRRILGDQRRHHQDRLLDIPAWQAYIRLHVERIQGHRHQIVLADCKHPIHQLLGIEMTCERLPGAIGDKGIGMQFVGGLQQQAIQF